LRNQVNAGGGLEDRQLGPLLAHPVFQIGDQRHAQLLPNRPVLGALIIGASMRRTASSTSGEITLVVLPSASRRAAAATSAIH
jgi:hypothetical protein